MTPDNPMPENVKISIINYLSGKWDECNSSILTSWLEESTENQQLFRELIDLWEAENSIKLEKHFDTEQAWNQIAPKLSTGNAFERYLPGLKQLTRYAAVFVFALFVGGLGYSWMQKNTESATTPSAVVEYTAPYGSKTHLKLLDGSLVRLNAGTTLKYNNGFGSRNRDIELNGEAYFEVAKNKKLPFNVKVREVLVTALGTKFNVKAYLEEETIETILLEGSVKVQRIHPGKTESLLLNPNHKAVFNMENNRFTVSPIENTSEVSWISNKWIIKNMRLEDFTKLMGRRYNVVFTFEEDQIKNYELGGTIMDETIEQVLTAITYSAPVKYKIVNNQISLSIDNNKLKTYKLLLK